MKTAHRWLEPAEDAGVPSPIGHALGGLALAWAVAPPDLSSRDGRRQAVILAAITVAPDLDLLIGRHSAETHSLGAALIVAAIAAWQRWPVARERWRIGLAVFLAWASHPLFDSLGQDGTPPLGVMAFWPFSREYVRTGIVVFMPISRRWWLDEFVVHNLTAVAREILILLPIATASYFLNRVRRLPT